MSVTQKDIDEISIQIQHTKRKIEIMNDNGFFGEMIDNFAGNNIETEKKRLEKLETLKQKKTTALKFSYLNGKGKLKKSVDEIKKNDFSKEKLKTPMQKKTKVLIDNNDYDEEEHSTFRTLRYLFFIFAIILGCVYFTGLNLGYSSYTLESAGYNLLQIIIMILVIVSFIYKSN